ncbi:hypothetical protein INT43_003227 [Umbelopsis isabellina]|uniref:Uncharacterized protein n=1 Tax=Mortierella isabellina TaxID=91625 RepID=A0A8H7PPF1_MORIS|nr:hypothetical protein INT43_003227 [Umbelopsis isabellina]
MNNWVHPDPIMNERMVHARHGLLVKWCGCMSLRGGSAFAAVVWLGLNIYLTVLSFEARSPIYSDLNFNALMVTGVICLLFCLGSLFTLFALFQNRPPTVRMAHQLTWLCVFAFLTDAFINIIVFGILHGDFQNWCMDRSKGYVDEQITAILGNGTQITMSFTPSQDGTDIYNCQKMWEDELKLGIVVWIVFALVYIYWATCLWSYSQKKKLLEIYTIQMNNNPNVMMNLPPGASARDVEYEDDGGKSMAQRSREIYSGLRAMLSRNRAQPQMNPVKYG